MKKLIERIVLSDLFVKAFVYVGALLFTLFFSVQLV